MKSLLILLGMSALAGYRVASPLPRHLSYLPEPEFGPLVSCVELEKRDGLVTKKGTGQTFSGQTIIYSGGLLHIQAFRNGADPTYLPEPPEVGGLMFPNHPACHVAVREYIQEHGPGHNEYMFLMEYGTKADLPVLLYGLQSMGETTNRAIVCTRAHCVYALEMISGARPGYNYSDWAQWWKQQHRTDPPQWKPERE